MKLLSNGLGHTFKRPAPLEMEHGKDGGAGTVIAHLPGERAPSPQGVERQSGHAGAILGPGIARGLAPGLQGHPDRPVTGLDVGEDLDGCG